MHTGYEIILIIIVAILVGVFFLGVWYGEDEIQTHAIQRGYAEYCSTTGHWSWAGECDDGRE